jgi:hypothetical protein
VFLGPLETKPSLWAFLLRRFEMDEKKEDKALFPPDESMELRSLLEEKGFRVQRIDSSIYEDAPRQRVYSIHLLRKA